MQTSTTNQWFGIDANKEISLFEYGILVRQDEKDCYTVIYSIGDNIFDTATITNVECNYLTKESWFDFPAFLSFVGMESDDFYSSDIASKLQSMLQYYGYQNIFGDSWAPLSKDDVIELTGL